MKYRIQTNWSYPTDESQWKNKQYIVSVDARGYDTKEDIITEDFQRALRRFKNDIGMARMAPAPQRIVDENDKVIMYYSPIRWRDGLPCIQLESGEWVEESSI